MARPLDPADVDKAIELYLAGESMEKIRATTGVSTTVLHRQRTSRGIPPRSHKVLPIDEIVAAYLAGASEYAIGRQYGVSRNVIEHRLAQQGIERRDPAAAGKLRASQMTGPQRKAQAAAANRAARLRRVPQIEKHRHALNREIRGEHGSAGESRLAALLTERGAQPTPQRAIGVYNVDLAVLPVAVEVLGGSPELRANYAERTPYILDEGWHLVLVWDKQGRHAIGTGAADYLVAFFEQVRRNPPATCQYRVITGQGEILAARAREDNEFPVVPPPRGRQGRRP